MADGIEDTFTNPSGWDALRQMFIDNNMPELADIITASLQTNGVDNSNLIYEDLRKSDTYKTRFKGNFDRLASGKVALSERAYLEQEKMYAETLNSYSAGTLAKRENYEKFIANDVSVNELANRFDTAYTRVTNAVNANDKALVDELKRMYPGVTDSELATSLLLGKEGSKFLDTKINIAEIKAAETTAGIKSALGSEFLESRGVSREVAAAGLAKTAAQTTGYQQAASRYGVVAPSELQQELERENILGQQGVKTKKLASQARAEFGGQTGVRTGSLSRKSSGQI